MSSKETPADISALLKENYKPNKYIPIEDNIEEQSQDIQEALKELWGFAFMLNRQGRKFTKTDCFNQLQLFDEKIPGLTLEKIETMFQKVFEKHKDEFGIANKPDIAKVELWMKKKYDFIYNEITQTSEFKDKSQRKFVELNVDTIYRQLQHVGFRFGMDKLKSLFKSDFVNTYNPFQDYFDNLEPWDGQTDHIAQLANYVKVKDQDFYTGQFKKMMVRCIGCSLYGQENRFVFTFVGEKQSTGKSTFIRFLNPFGKDQYYTEAPIRNNKDSEFAFAENFTYNLEELSSLSNVDVNRLKSIISLAMIKERKAYATNVVAMFRRCNFWASTNKGEFLTDTENTRWLCFEVVGIDWDYKTQVNIKKVWAQAFALYKDESFNSQLTPEEVQERDAKNKNYEITDLEKELIKKSFAVAWKDEGGFYSNADILSVIQEGTKSKLESRFIGKNMKQLGFEPDVKKINGHTTRGWWAKYIAPKEGQGPDYKNDDEGEMKF